MVRPLSVAVHAAVVAAALWPVSTVRAQTAPPQDVAYPGTLALQVDATDLDHRVFHATQQVPVQPGPLTLLYPQWIQGTHSPTGPINTAMASASRGGATRSTCTRSSWWCRRA